MAEPSLDLITIGRVSVDLYGQQTGGRLEDMSSFAKYVGGCPANIAVGAARLGLKSALLSRVGDEHMGRFVREQLTREGVDVSGLKTDPARLTALVILGIRDQTTFPLIFYRENCADMALDVDDVEESFIASARATVVTGTHFSTPSVAAASHRAMKMARRHARKVIFDIDYRPVLWGLTGHGLGENRFVDSAEVTRRLQAILPYCDVVVGTEEEIHVAGGSTDTIAALRQIRAQSAALIVLKRGDHGCVAFAGSVPARLDEGLVVGGFPIEVYNVLGAGDAFMSGFLSGYLRNEPLAEACRIANASGALVVSRHSCAPASPTRIELQHFLEHGSPHRALRHDEALNHIHWATTRRGDWPEICALAFDHRIQLERIAQRHHQPISRIADFKMLIYRAACRASGEDRSFGILVDERFGRAVLDQAGGKKHWVARPIELPENTPLVFEGGRDPGIILREWPVNYVVKCLVYWHPDDPAELAEAQQRQIAMLGEACRQTDHELLLEVIADRKNPGDARPTAAIMRRIYGLGVRPDWWKLAAPGDDAGWALIDQTIRQSDPYCRGVLLLGLDASEADLIRSLGAAARQPICKGFAIGRSIFGAAAEAWFAGKMADEAAVEQIAAYYGRLTEAWQAARQKHAGPSERTGSRRNVG
jgi:5-dehydro-2-deoxygluconokinase